MKLAWISLVVVTVAMSCQSERDFGSPEDGTGGGAGEKATGDGDGDGDAGGAKGDGDGDGDNQPEPECVRASDCPAADGCNEAATCEDGECVPGASECGEFDSENCACVELDGDCTVQGTDADEDGFKSALCEADPGDDCNDAQATVYPDAEEVCDGLDNDCNGFTDLDDGLEPFVRRVDLPDTGETYYYDTELAWSPTVGAYGVAWTTATSTALVRHEVNWGWIELDGSFKKTLSSIIRSDVDNSIRQLAAATGEKEIVVVAVEEVTGDSALIHVRRLAKPGTSTIGEVTSFSTSFPSVIDLQVIENGPDDWIVSYASSEDGIVTTYLCHIQKGELVTGTFETPLTNSAKDFVESDSVLLPWSSFVGSETAPKWSVLTANSLQAVAGGAVPTTDGFVSVPSAPGPRLGFVSQNGSTEQAEFFSMSAKEWECKNASLPFVSGVGPVAPLSLLDGGWLLVSRQLGTYGSSELYFSRVYPDCSSSFGVAKHPFVGVEDRIGASREQIVAAGNGKGAAVIWYQTAARNLRYVSLFGPNICDDPDQ